MTRKILLFIILGMLSFGCKMMNNAVLKPQGIENITYRFVDSSVPPQYHRSYSIIVNPERIKLIIDSYGDILFEKDFGSDLKKFASIIESFNKSKIKLREEQENQGCTGGTSERVIINYLSAPQFNAYVYHCMGDWGTLTGDINRFASTMKSLIPDFDSTLKGI